MGILCFRKRHLTLKNWLFRLGNNSISWRPISPSEIRSAIVSRSLYLLLKLSIQYIRALLIRNLNSIRTSTCISATDSKSIFLQIDSPYHQKNDFDLQRPLNNNPVAPPAIMVVAVYTSKMPWNFLVNGISSRQARDINTHNCSNRKLQQLLA